MVEEKEIIEEQKEKVVEHKNTEKMWRVIGSILTIFLVIILIIWATNTQNFKIFPFLAFLGSIIILFVGLFFGVGWYRNFQELKDKKTLEGKLPPAITIEQASEIISKQMLNPRYADYVQSWKQHKMYNIGKGIKNRILVVQLETTYNPNPYQFFLLNMHYPSEMWDYVCQDKYNPYEIIKLVNALAVSPEDEPDEREIITENLLTGNRITTKEKMKPKKPQKKEEETEGDGLE